MSKVTLSKIEKEKKKSAAFKRSMYLAINSIGCQFMRYFGDYTRAVKVEKFHGLDYPVCQITISIPGNLNEVGVVYPQFGLIILKKYRPELSEREDHQQSRRLELGKDISTKMGYETAIERYSSERGLTRVFRKQLENPGTMAHRTMQEGGESTSMLFPIWIED